MPNPLEAFSRLSPLMKGVVLAAIAGIGIFAIIKLKGSGGTSANSPVSPNGVVGNQTISDLLKGLGYDTSTNNPGPAPTNNPTPPMTHPGTEPAQPVGAASPKTPYTPGGAAPLRNPWAGGPGGIASPANPIGRLRPGGGRPMPHPGTEPAQPVSNAPAQPLRNPWQGGPGGPASPVVRPPNPVPPSTERFVTVDRFGHGPNDTLSDIAASNNVHGGWQFIWNLNPQIKNPNVIQPGERVRIA